MFYPAGGRSSLRSPDDELTNERRGSGIRLLEEAPGDQESLSSCDMGQHLFSLTQAMTGGSAGTTAVARVTEENTQWQSHGSVTAGVQDERTPSLPRPGRELATEAMRSAREASVGASSLRRRFQSCPPRTLRQQRHGSIHLTRQDCKTEGAVEPVDSTAARRDLELAARSK